MLCSEEQGWGVGSSDAPDEDVEREDDEENRPAPCSHFSKILRFNICIQPFRDPGKRAARRIPESWDAFNCLKPFHGPHMQPRSPLVGALTQQVTSRW